MNENEADSHKAIDLANSILIEMDRKELDPVLCYAALGCAFEQLHYALGHSAIDWLLTTKQMAKIREENKK